MKILRVALKGFYFILDRAIPPEGANTYLGNAQYSKVKNIISKQLLRLPANNQLKLPLF